MWVFREGSILLVGVGMRVKLFYLFLVGGHVVWHGFDTTVFHAGWREARSSLEVRVWVSRWYSHFSSRLYCLSPISDGPFVVFALRRWSRGKEAGLCRWCP